MMRKCFLVILSYGMISTPAWADQADLSHQKEVAVTVYNNNLGFIKETRIVPLNAGHITLSYRDVASGIDPTSVSLKTKDPGIKVYEQNYEYDLITPERLMEKYVGKEIALLRDGRTTKATLLSTNEGYVYKVGEEIHLQPPGQIVLPKLPDNLVSQPTLIWSLDNSKAQAQSLEVGYLTSGMNWQTNYVLSLNPENTQASLAGWVTVNNQSGADYRNAKLTLVAGTPNRVRRGGNAPVMAKMAREEMDEFTEDSVFEYHSYQLERPTTLKNRQSKQIALLSAKSVPVAKRYVFEAPPVPIWQSTAGKQSAKAQTWIDFNNTKAAQLGFALPKGIVRVYQESQAQWQYVGEDSIDHTPRDEKVSLKVGEAFDIVGDRQQTKYHRLGDRQSESGYRIALRNHKDIPVTVTVVEKLSGDWSVTEKSQDYVKRDAQTLEFTVTIPARQEKVVTYTVKTVY